MKQRRRRDRKAIFFISPSELANGDGPAAGGDDASVGLGVEVEVGEHVGEVSEGDVGPEDGGGGGADESGAGSELEDVETGSGREEERRRVAVEEGDEGGGGGP